MRQTPNFSTLFLLLCLSLAGAAARVDAQMLDGRELVRASLVSSLKTAAPGEKITVAVRLQMEPHWHTYWEFGGDGGFATQVKWTLPEGAVVEGPKWPLPRRFLLGGEIVSYGYETETLLLFHITLPEKMDGDSITLVADVNWLVCEETCIPGKANLELRLPLALEPIADTEGAAQIAAYEKRLPQPLPDGAGAGWQSKGKSLELTVTGLPPGEYEFFPLPGKAVIGHPIVTSTPDAIRVEVPLLSEDPTLVGMGGVLVSQPSKADADPARVGYVIPADARLATASAAAASGAAGSSTVWSLQMFSMLGFGLLGGLILNIMPCVFPVVSLKIYSFMEQANQDRGKVFRLGLAFVAGIFTWFLALGAFTAGLKMAGREVSWAFQFQNPWFLIFLSAIIVVFSLNLLGVFEVILPGNAGTKLAGATAGGGYAASFTHGLLATVLATPCTAPLLGTAIGYAFGLDPLAILLMFASIALGMSLPYFFLTAFPGWMRYLPKPGAWMEVFKQAVGFLLLAVVLWLVWVIGRQRGVDAMLWVLVFLFGLGYGTWGIGVLQRRAVKKHRLLFGGSTALFVGCLAFYSLGMKMNAKEEVGIPWEPFSKTALAEALRGDRIVFIDFTADWCISCKFNERTVLETSPVITAFAEAGVLPMKADWTNADPDITDALKSFGRAGVPLYVFYPQDRSAAPVVLPEILTKDLVLEGLKSAQSPPRK